MHLRTRLVCSGIFHISFEKFAIYFFNIFKDLCIENRGKLRGKYKGNRKIENSVFQIPARLVKIIKLVEHRVAVFSRSPLISQEVKFNCAVLFLAEKINR